MASNLKQKIKEIKKDYFTVSDLEKISALRRNSLLVALNRMVKKGEITRLTRGIYQRVDLPIELEKIATQIYSPSYVSFESALAIHGILSQIPYVLTLATTKRPKKIKIAGRIVEYRRLKKKLFFGFKLVDNVYLASKEKALLDQLYLMSKGKAYLSLEELDLREVKRKLFLDLAKKYPEPTRKLARKLV